MESTRATQAPDAEAPRTPAGGVPPRKPRDPLIDNVRFLLIVLVVFGHFLTSLRDNPLIDGVYTWIYLFHMPAFVFLSGLVINSYVLNARGARRIVTGLLAPFAIFTVLYQVFGTLVDQPVPSDDPLRDPYWLLWFLMALALWRISVPLLGGLRWPVATTVVTSTVLVTYVNLSSWWSIDRYVVLMPFFTAGLVRRPAAMQRVRSVGWRIVAVGVLLASVPVAIWAKDLPGGFITYSDGVDSPSEVPDFLALYVIAAAMIMAIVALAPGGRGRISLWGTRTIYVYLLHGFFVRAFRATELSSVLDTTAGMIVTLVASVVLAMILSSALVVRIARPLVEPRLEWFMRESPPAGTGDGGTAVAAADAPRAS